MTTEHPTAANTSPDAPKPPRTLFPPVDLATWRARVEQELKGAPFEKSLQTVLLEGLELSPLYTPSDLPSGHASPPGAWPFARGAEAGPRASSEPDPKSPPPWQACMLDPPDASTANAWALEALAGGSNALILRWDRISQQACGLPASGTCGGGVGGIPLYRRADLQVALRDVRLNAIHLSLEPGANALPAAGMLLALCEAEGLEPADLHLHLGADPLGTLARDGCLPCHLESALSELAGLARACDAGLPRARALTVSTRAYHLAGADGVQELAYALSTAVAYLRSLEQAGLPPRAAARQFVFSVPVGRDIFLEIARLRALRLLWGRILAACDALPAAGGLPFFLETFPSPRTMTAFDPWVNMLRVTSEVFASLLGGADLISSAAFDQALGLPDPLARRLARNTPLILLEESHLDRVQDPAGGSYYLEHLTDAVARLAWQHFQSLEADGGMIPALLEGHLHAEIAQKRAARMAAIHRRKEALVGVTEFPLATEALLERPTPPDPGQQTALLRAHLDALAARGPLEVEIRASSGPPGPLALSTATAGGMAGASLFELAAARGEEPLILSAGALPQHRDSQDFDSLRARVMRARAQGRTLRVFLANLGPLAEHSLRATWSRNVFQIAGLEVVDGSGLAVEGDREANLRDLADELRASGADVACICGTDVRYPSLAVPVAGMLASLGLRQILLAGRPGSLEQELRAAGVQEFISLGMDIYLALEALVSRWEVA